MKSRSRLFTVLLALCACVGASTRKRRDDTLGARVFAALDAHMPALPPALAALVDQSRAPDEAVGLQALRDAQRSLHELLKTSVAPAFLIGSAGGDARLEAAGLRDGLGALATLWQHETLRPLLTARHLPMELAALVLICYCTPPPFPLEQAAEVTDLQAWSKARLDELLAHEPPLALIEAFISLLRHPGAPTWRKAACSSLPDALRASPTRRP